MSTTPPHIFSKEWENRGALEKAPTPISLWQLVFVTFQISGSTEWVHPQYLIPSHDPVYYNHSKANFRELFENPQSFCPHSRSQTLRNFEGYPHQFSNPGAALVLKNSRNLRTRMRIFEKFSKIYVSGATLWWYKRCA